MQALYMYYTSPEDAARQKHVANMLDKNMDRFYQLYLYMLQFLVEFQRFSGNYLSELRSRYVPSQTDLKGVNLLVEHPVLLFLAQSKHLEGLCEKYKVHWEGDDDLLRKIMLDLKSQSVYNDYVGHLDQSSPTDADHSRGVELINFLLRHYSTNMGMFVSHLEETWPNWTDDRKIVMQMLVRTVKGIYSGEPEEQAILSESENPEMNREFAHDLLRLTTSNEETLNQYVFNKAGQYEPHQFALVDLIVLRMAVCEFLHFPSIPHTVTINEYVELSKVYSTPQSKKFVNGVLDAISKDVAEQKKGTTN